MKKEEKNLIFEFVDDIISLKYIIISIIFIFIIIAYFFNNIYRIKYNVELFFSPQTRDYGNMLRPGIAASFTDYDIFTVKGATTSSEIILNDFVTQFETHKQLKDSIITNSKILKNLDYDEERKNDLINSIARSFVIIRPEKDRNLWKIKFQTENVAESIDILNGAINSIFNDVTNVYSKSLNTKITNILNKENMELKIKKQTIQDIFNQFNNQINYQILLLEEQLEIAKYKKISNDELFLKFLNKKTILNNLDKFNFLKGTERLKKEISVLKARKEKFNNDPGNYMNSSVLGKEMNDKIYNLYEEKEVLVKKLFQLNQIKNQFKNLAIEPIIIDTKTYSARPNIKKSTIYMLFILIGTIFGITFSLFTKKYLSYRRTYRNTS